MNTLQILNERIKILSGTSLTDLPKVTSAALELEQKLLNEQLNTQEEKELIEVVQRNGLLDKLQKIYNNFEVELEISFSKKFLKREISGIEEYLLYKRFEVLIKNEIALADIKKSDKVLFIGSGPFPITAIILNRLIGCSVDCADLNKEAVEISSKVISKLGLKNKIRILNVKGQLVTDVSYNVVVVALLAKPKNEILSHLAQVMPESIKIICRTSDGIRQVFYEQTTEACFKGFKIIAKNFAKGDQTISSVLLKK